MGGVAPQDPEFPVADEEAPRPASEDRRRRERLYILLMGVRLLCFALFVFVPGYWKIAPAAGFIVLPWIAVTIANMSALGTTEGFGTTWTMTPPDEEGPRGVDAARPPAGELPATPPTVESTSHGPGDRSPGGSPAGSATTPTTPTNPNGPPTTPTSEEDT